MPFFKDVEKPTGQLFNPAGPASRRKEQPRIAITGIGFVCPVGRSFWDAALSLRKKKSRFFCHETVLVADDRYGTVLRGATVSRMADDVVSPWLDSTERAVILLSSAVMECLRGIDHKQ